MSKKGHCTCCPDIINDVDISDCCEEHDDDYREGKPRKKSDKAFYRCIRCSKNSDGKRVSKGDARKIYKAVRMFGWINYSMATIKRWIKGFRDERQKLEN